MQQELGEVFQADLAERVEDTALAKPVPITMKQKEESNNSHTPRNNPRDYQFFFLLGASSQVQRQAKQECQSMQPLSSHKMDPRRSKFRGPGDSKASSMNQGSPQVKHLCREQNPNKEVPQSQLGSLGTKIVMHIVYTQADLSV